MARILLVETDTQLRSNLAYQLTSAGHTLIKLGSNESVLQLMTGSTIEVILIDINLWLDELLRFIPHTPIILLINFPEEYQKRGIFQLHTTQKISLRLIY